MAALEGTLHGNTITMDLVVPPLEGRRVRVVIEPLDEGEVTLTPNQQAQLWREWVERGPQGPIEAATLTASRATATTRDSSPGYR